MEVEFLIELRDILKQLYKDGGLSSVNFVTQGGSFYFKTEEDFLERLGELDYLVSNKNKPYLVKPSDVIGIKGVAHEVISLTWGSKGQVFAKVANIESESIDFINLNETDFIL